MTKVPNNTFGRFQNHCVDYEGEESFGKARIDQDGPLVMISPVVVLGTSYTDLPTDFLDTSVMHESTNRIPRKKFKPRGDIRS